MASSHSLQAFISYAHEDEDHHRRLAEHLGKLRTDGLIDSWDDREILAGERWDAKIKKRLKQAQIIVLMVSRQFLASPYVRDVEIPLAMERQDNGDAHIVCVILDDCDWKTYFSSYQVLPPSATPVDQWPDRDSAYAVIASGIGALAREWRKGIAQIARDDREFRRRTIYRHTPFRIVGENYDPFHAFQHVFRRRHLYTEGTTPFPLNLISEDQVEFLAWDYQTIFATLRDSTQPPGLDCDLIAIPYFLLGHCVERGLLQPLDDRLKANETNFAYWYEMSLYQGRLYGVPLSSLTTILAVRTDLFDQYGLSVPDTWTDYLQLIEDATKRRLPVAPALLQGRDHITLWYDWLNHLYANDTNDLVLYGGSRLPAREAAETLRKGTESYLAMAAMLAAFADGRSALPHWATANWDDGIEAFAHGQLLTHMVFNDALDTLRRRMEIRQDDRSSGYCVGYFPVPTAIGSGKRNGHVEGWILCVPTGARYYEAANDVLEWFLQRRIQEAYAIWGGASGDYVVIDDQARNDKDGGAGLSFKTSVENSQKGRTVVNLVKHNGPRTLEVIDRIRANLYDAVLAVAGQKQSPAAAADLLVQRVAQRLLSRTT
jgi:ABC-type glycerol-3-phosphate transport system substrate-binding protein